ncbi:MAG: hypothetical protein SOZ23_02875 [Methanosphaera sp.]|uniref:hypothetical protein n=1 Tax=Methanosphaera sp. TaxID=2666342 RepID=UPI0025F5D42B|nr:hypothetical protein [Methanosphaera sp.]MCI5867322.1 hypothetical protein [Methanosphaera sp.]MDD6534610.1 hypothetical protein [Methanosphaera sp.]MDY3955722.1 hypothetical protein [Methanosphaera sp.]
MYIKVRRDTLVILILAFILILSGRLMTYVAFASSESTGDDVPIAGIMVKGNDIIPTSTIKANVEAAGFRSNSTINGNTLITSQRQLLLSDAQQNAAEMVKKSTIPGTSIAPINAVDVQVDTKTGNVVVTVVEDFSVLQKNMSSIPKNSTNSTNSTKAGV